MPAQVPPEAQSIGRARGRLSASSLTTFRRCEKQWFLNYRVGLRGPLSPPQVMGIEVEDAFCSILMHRAPKVNSFDELKEWLLSLVESHAAKAIEEGKSTFEDAMWKKGDFDEYFDIKKVSEMLINGINLQLEEVKTASMQEVASISLKFQHLAGIHLLISLSQRKLTAWLSGKIFLISSVKR